jgi:hypothetical protein
MNKPIIILYVSSEGIEICLLKDLSDRCLVLIGECLYRMLKLIVLSLHPSECFRKDEGKGFLVGLKCSDLSVDAGQLEFKIVDPFIFLRIK